MAKQDIDAVTGIATTGHEWDGICSHLSNRVARPNYYAHARLALAFHYPVARQWADHDATRISVTQRLKHRSLATPSPAIAGAAVPASGRPSSN